jgi:hypothetical protein
MFEKKPDRLLELARHRAGFTLFERPALSSATWRTLKLCRAPRATGKKITGT